MLTSLLINGFRSRLQECLDSQLLVGRVFNFDYVRSNARRNNSSVLARLR